MVRLIEFNEDATVNRSDGKTDSVAYMTLELVPNGELFDYVALRKFSPKVCRFYCKQILNCLHYMHSKGVAHRDLKPENIMIDDKFNVKIADFGFAAST